MDTSHLPLVGSEVSVFPNDVSGFGGFSEEELGLHQLKLGWFFLTEKALYRLKVLSKNISIFLFESNESTNWSSEFLIFCSIIL